MSTYLPPSKTPLSNHEIERFNRMYRSVHLRLAPGNEVEHSLCNEIVVALWHFRCFRSKALALEKRLKTLESNEANPKPLTDERRALSKALRQAKIQKNFAWRRRGKFFFLKTMRENEERLLKAA
jgi:hypothetical protein